MKFFINSQFYRNSHELVVKSDFSNACNSVCHEQMIGLQIKIIGNAKLKHCCTKIG